MADDEVHQAYELWNEKNECEYGEAKDGVRRNFASDVSIEQAHVRAPSF
jgi:hypothetical protein